MSRIIVSLLVIVLLSVGAVGCLGSDGGEEAQKIAGDIILTIEDFPSGWREATPEYFAINTTDNYAIRAFEVGVNMPSSVEIAVVVYGSESMAQEIFSNFSDRFAFTGPSTLNIGDEGLILHANSLVWYSMMIVFREGNVVVASIADYTSALPITESWLIDLMELQESRI